MDNDPQCGGLGYSGAGSSVSSVSYHYAVRLMRHGVVYPWCGLRWLESALQAAFGAQLGLAYVLDSVSVQR